MVTLRSSESFFSNLDKHRGVHLPTFTTDEVCLEAGIDLGDGTHILYKPGARHSSYIYSISQRYPDEWFATNFILSNLLLALYGIRPKLRSSSPRRNGICVYLNSRAVLLFKRQVLGLPSGERSRKVSVPVVIRARGDEGLLRFFEGYQYADGSFVCGSRPCLRITTSSINLARDVRNVAERISVCYSMSRDHPLTGFSLRISQEESMRCWLKHIPLLNPIQISKFLIWQRYSECPPRLFLSQCVSLLIGESHPATFPKEPSAEILRTRFLQSVDLLTLFLISKQAFGLWDLARASAARSIGAILASVNRLRKDGLVNREMFRGQTRYLLKPRGVELVGHLEEAWQTIRGINSRIESLNSYECPTVPRLGAEEPPRLAS